MLLRTLDILEQFYTPNKDTESMLYSMSSKQKYFAMHPLKQYSYGFVERRSDHDNILQRIPITIKKLDIWDDIEEAETNKINIHINGDEFEGLTYDVENCLYNCRRDCYDQYHTLIFQLLKSNKRSVDI